MIIPLRRPTLAEIRIRAVSALIGRLRNPFRIIDAVDWITAACIVGGVAYWGLR